MEILPHLKHTLLLTDFQNMRLHALSEIPSIRLQESAGTNPDRTDRFGILHYQQCKEEQKKLLITELKGKVEERTR